MVRSASSVPATARSGRSVRSLPDGPLRTTLDTAVQAVDESIDEIRLAVFDLRGGPDMARS
jgi:signal transduction histidine kinase